MSLNLYWGDEEDIMRCAMNQPPLNGDQKERRCGTCKHSVWLSNGEGECHGAWWSFYRHRPYRWMRPEYVEMRPFLLSKGCGEKCGTWESKRGLIEVPT